MSLPDLQYALADLYGDPVPATEVTQLRGDASTRSYFRARVAHSKPGLPTDLIVMRLPEDLFQSDEGGTRETPTRLPFLEVAELLRSRGLPVPEIYAEDLEHGILLLEDLGDLTLFDELTRSSAEAWSTRYGRAVDLLAELHTRCETLPESSIVARRCFDRALLDWELDHFREWGLEAQFGGLEPNDATELRRAFQTIAERIEAMPYGFVHRDYQSKNLMVRPDGALVLIDFQDALLGPRVYDLVALLCDSYVDLDLELQDTMIARYAALRRIDVGALREEFWWVALQRKLKDAGRFVFIDRVRNNPDFLKWFPQSLVYVGRAAEQVAGMQSLSALLRRTIPGFPDTVSKPASSSE